MNYIYYMWELFINILEGFNFFLLLNGKLYKKNIEHIYIKQLLTLLPQAALVFIFNILNIPPVITILLFVFFHYIYACIFFESAHIMSIFWVIIYAGSTIVADALTTIIPTKLFNISIDSLLIRGSLRVPFTLVYITLLTIITTTLLYFSSKIIRLNSYEKIIYILLSLICLSIEELIVVSQTSSYDDRLQKNTNIIYIIFFLVMIQYIVFVFYVYNLGIEREKNMQLKEMQIQSAIEKKRYDEIVSSISELRYMKHDINNHLETIHSMLANEKYIELKNYISDLTKSLNESYYILSSGNSVVDSIITNKLIQCKEESISVNYEIRLPKKIPISNFEFSSLLGNLFDNAIEACNELGSNIEKKIDFLIYPYKNMLSIMISNSSNGKYLYDEHNHFKSTKSNAKITEHGIGLNRVKYIVETHRGIIEITPKEVEFKVYILLPLE